MAVSDDRYRIPKTTCPSCGITAEHSESAYGDDAVPAPGQINVCAGCATVLRFRDDMSLEAVSSQWIADLSIRSPEDFIRLMDVCTTVKRHLSKH